MFKLTSVYMICYIFLVMKTYNYMRATGSLFVSPHALREGEREDKLHTYQFYCLGILQCHNVTSG